MFQVRRATQESTPWRGLSLEAKEEARLPIPFYL
jgi:hypothetical protein